MPGVGHVLVDDVPVLPATLERAWAIDPKRGIETRAVADGVCIVTDGVWQSAFAVANAGVVVLDATQIFGARIPAEVAAVTGQPITTLVHTHAQNDHQHQQLSNQEWTPSTPSEAGFPPMLSCGVKRSPKLRSRT